MSIPAVLQTCRKDDEGSVLPLILGFLALVAALVLVAANVTDIFLSQKRLDALADAAALAASDAAVLRVDDGEAQLVLDNAAVARSVALFLGDEREVSVVAASTPDGRSAHIRLSTVWRPAFVGFFVPEGVLLEARAMSRMALDRSSP